jgi:hypothetical protein
LQTVVPARFAPLGMAQGVHTGRRFARRFLAALGMTGGRGEGDAKRATAAPARLASPLQGSPLHASRPPRRGERGGGNTYSPLG